MAAEWDVKNILGHSARPEADGTLHGMKFLIEWEGVGKDGSPYPHSWEDFIDVGIPLLAGYVHRMAMGYPRMALLKPDGFVYLYVDDTAQDHVPRPDAPAATETTYQPPNATAGFEEVWGQQGPPRVIWHQPPRGAKTTATTSGGTTQESSSRGSIRKPSSRGTTQASSPSGMTQASSSSGFAKKGVARPTKTSADKSHDPKKPVGVKDRKARAVAAKKSVSA